MAKSHIPFTKLPKKANFNYISPVTFNEDVSDNAPLFVSINEMGQEIEEQTHSFHLLKTLEQVKSIKEIKVKWNSFIKMK
jgi:hypothetical protein